ncbi:hypothetical protein BOKEGFJH_00321 [Chlamydia avium]|uniref:Uncharacterized protein n=1 Tax=Chlamydia avium TaxID=1457141 RepID=A0ABN0MSA3_9CHLA|nr:hypothetical protein [Chlamydia avium]EPP36409.1 hypothetical protein CP10743SC13_0658 [Chlamydia psittaci 10_743_SC13]EPP38376.1 hypothetical protein CP10881SC42_0738 [Chlamydia avium]VVT42805.1 hypothetical protein BOKEGFJH_00321 [Chlamydia avium]
MKKKQFIKSSSPVSLTNNIDDAGTGIKDQNLYFEDATIDISGNLAIDDQFQARSLSVTDQVTTNCDLFVGGNVSGNNGMNLNETTLSGDMLITANSQESAPLFNNIADPVSQRDAITYNYYQNKTLQTYTCCSKYYSSKSFISSDTNIRFRTEEAYNSESYTLLYRNYFDIPSNGEYIKLKALGNYQVSYQIVRNKGAHNGNDESTIFLKLNRDNQESEILCSGDTRGNNRWEQTGTPLFAMFSITDLTGNPNICVFTNKFIYPYTSTISIIWFPFPITFFEED